MATPITQPTPGGPSRRQASCDPGPIPKYHWNREIEINREAPGLEELLKEQPEHVGGILLTASHYELTANAWQYAEDREHSQWAQSVREAFSLLETAKGARKAQERELVKYATTLRVMIQGLDDADRTIIYEALAPLNDRVRNIWFGMNPSVIKTVDKETEQALKQPAPWKLP